MRAMCTVYAGLWRRARQTFFLVLVGIGAGYGVVWLATSQGMRDPRGDKSDDFMIAMLIVGVAGLVGAAAVLLANSDADRLMLGLPERVLRMPMRTWKLALIHIAFGVSMAAVVALAATLPAHFVLKRIEIVWWMPVAALGVLVPLAQLWAYAMGNAGLRTAVTSFLVYFSALAWLAQRPALVSLLKAGGAAVVIGVVVLLVLIFLAMSAVTRVQRRGGWAASLQRGGQELAMPRARRPFRSRATAQFWFEWRQFGMLMPAYVVGVAAAYFVGMPLVVGLFRMTEVTGKSSGEGVFHIDWLTSAQYVWMGLFLSSFIGSMFVGGVMFMRGGHWNSASSYLVTRPLTITRIANARLLVLGAGAGLAIGLLIAITGSIEGVVRLQGESTGLGFFLHQGYELLPEWVVLAMHFGFLLVLMWACAWPMSFAFALAGFAALLLPMMGAMWGGALIGLLTPDAAKSHIEAWSPTLQWIAAALVMTAFLALAWSAIRRGYVHPLAPLLGTALWFAYSWGFVHFVNRWEVPPGVKDWYVRFPHPINWPMWMAVSIVPLVPFFLHPLIMARIRHR